MERLQKYVILRGEFGQSKHLALIDTGTPRVILPRRVADQVGTMETGRKGHLNIRGSRLGVEIHTVDVEIVTGGCRATVEALVPKEDDSRTPIIVGSLFLQKTGATIHYRGSHPVFCMNGEFEDESWSGEFEPARSSRRKRR